MVHGGGWRRGDKQMVNVVTNKVDHWVTNGNDIFVSINYPLNTDPYAMCESVAQALAFSQGKAREWGGDPDRFILMGHSAGAHLVTLLNSDTSIAERAGCRPWLGTIALDSAAYNVVDIMDGRHAGLYDEAFNTPPHDGLEYWRKCSPQQQLKQKIAPFLGVYSIQRSEEADKDHCIEYIESAVALGSKADSYPVDLPHGGVNSELGVEGTAYTKRVDMFVNGVR